MELMATRWLTLAAAARLAGVGRTTLHYAAFRGELPFAIVAGRRLFRPEDVLRWAVATGRAQAPAEAASTT